MQNNIWTATETWSQLQAGQVEPQQIKSDLLLHIANIDSQINAFIYTDSSSAERNDGMLAGLPISVKDQFHIQNTLCSFGLDKSVHSTVTAQFVERLLNQGANLLGKTSLPPLAMDFQTSNSIVGTTNNPWNTAYTSGGSSGGGAAAVASGMSLVDIGADLAGSLRIPASYCGVYSLVPTDGNVSNQGLFIDPDVTIDHFARPGPIARAPEDLALIWQAYSGNAPTEPKNQTEFNLAYWTKLDTLPLDNDVSALLDKALAMWQQSGHSATQAKPEGFNFKACWQHYGEIMGYEVSKLLNPLLRWLMFFAGRGNARRSPQFLANVLQGYKRDKHTYQTALQQRQILRQHMDAFLDQYDAWILPVTPCRAFRHHQPDVERAGNREYKQPLMINGVEVNYLDALSAYTSPISLVGNPVVTMPIGVDSYGLPVGVQVVGKDNQELQLVEIVKQLAAPLSVPDCPMAKRQ